MSKMILTFIADLLTVSETAAEPPQDEGNSLNSPRNLALEATFSNHNYSQQVLKCKYYIQEFALDIVRVAVAFSLCINVIKLKLIL